MAAVLWVRTGSLVACAVAVAACDVRSRRVPNALAVAGLAAGLVLAALSGWVALLGSLAGAGVFGGVLFVCWLCGLVGAGDAKAGFAFGALLGIPGAIEGLLWGAVVGVVLAGAFSGMALLRSAGRLRVALREGGISGAAAAVAAHPAWRVGIPYAAALAGGSLWALALVGRGL